MRNTALLIVAIVISVVIYMPSELQQAVFGRVVWSPLRVELLDSIRKYSVHGEFRVPYVDYTPQIADHGLPAPPLYGLVWALASYLGRAVGGSPGTTGFTAVVYAVQAVLVVVSVVLTTRVVKSTSLLPPLLLSTLALCGMYSLETLSLPLLALTLESISRRDYARSLLYAGLATSISYFNFALLAVLVFYALRENYFNKKSAVMLLLGLLPHVVLCTIRLEYFTLLVERVVYEPHTPLSIYRLISSFASEELVYRVSVALWLSLLVVLCSLTPRTPEYLASHVYTVLLVLYALHPYCYPQTLLLVISAGLLASRIRSRGYYLLLELLNASTLVLYLKSPNPLSLNDPAQLAGQARNALLIISALEALTALYREKYEV
jgi:hypothetical protein